MRKLFLMVMLCVACSITYADTAVVAAHTDATKAILVTKTNPQFTIHLPSNPSTGYSWFLQHYDDHSIVPVAHTFQKKTTANAVGAPVVEVWQFRVRKAAFVVPKQTALVFVYARPWESHAPARKLEFKVSIMK